MNEKLITGVKQWPSQYIGPKVKLLYFSLKFYWSNALEFKIIY